MPSGRMAATVALLVFVTGLGADALEPLDTSLERALDAGDAVSVYAVPHLPADVDALERATAEGATAVVEIETEPSWEHADLRVCPVDGSAPCELRTLSFGASDALADRQRAVSIVIVAMLPEATRRAATRQPEPTPLPPPPPVVVPVARKPLRFEADLAFSSALGAPSTFGGVGSLRVRTVGSLWARVGAGVRAGTLPGLAGRTLEVPLLLGLDLRWSLTASLALGARLDARLQSRAVHVDDATPPGRQRWLAAFQLGPELHWQLAPALGIVVFGGVELNAGTTTLQRSGGAADRLGLVRASLEVGPCLTF